MLHNGLIKIISFANLYIIYYISKENAEKMHISLSFLKLCLPHRRAGWQQQKNNYYTYITQKVGNVK